MATDDFAARLLAWFDLVQRDLPWRRTRDPWAIWVSEIMLQQTRVEAVRGPYERFLARYPTPAAFAAASDDEVMVAWRGLGYYRRARLLRAGGSAQKDAVCQSGWRHVDGDAAHTPPLRRQQHRKQREHVRRRGGRREAEATWRRAGMHCMPQTGGGPAKLAIIPYGTRTVPVP